MNISSVAGESPKTSVHEPEVFRAGGLPLLEQLGAENRRVLLQVIGQLCRDRLRVGGGGLGAAVAAIADQAHLIFQLDHDDGMSAGIHLP